MKKNILLLVICWMGILSVSRAQNITYSEPDKDDVRNMDYEIMGKMNGNILIYKNYRGSYYISIYDGDMKMTDKIKLDFLPDRIFNTDFLQYPDHFDVFYQYQKKNIVYAMAVSIDGNGKKIGDPVQLDTTEISYSASTKIYTVLNSDDKQKILLFKINSRNEKIHYVTSCLFDKDLKLLQRARIGVNMPDRNDFLTEFQLDNDGDLVYVRASGTTQNDNINKLTLITKPAAGDSVTYTDLRLNNVNLDDIRVKVDNFNKHYLVTSFYSKQKRGNIDGLYCYLWSKIEKKELLNTTVVFPDELRADARSDGGIKSAFNDFFLRNIVMKQDGGFVVASESVYTSSRGNNYNRWDYMNGTPGYGYGGFNSYYYSSPYGYYPWNRYNNYGVSVTRYYADNIAILSLDVTGKMEWNNVISKSQYDDNSDNFISYGVMNSGDQVHFLFNVQEKRQLVLTDQSITPDGQVLRAPTLKNLDRGYDFMPRHTKQTGSRQVIVPCEYRSYVCFAKIDF